MLALGQENPQVSSDPHEGLVPSYPTQPDPKPRHLTCVGLSTQARPGPNPQVSAGARRRACACMRVSACAHVKLGVWTERAGLRSWLSHLSAVWPGESNLTSLCLRHEE